eukprot:s679_g2.t1
MRHGHQPGIAPCTAYAIREHAKQETPEFTKNPLDLRNSEQSDVRRPVLPGTGKAANATLTSQCHEELWSEVAQTGAEAKAAARAAAKAAAKAAARAAAAKAGGGAAAAKVEAKVEDEAVPVAEAAGEAADAAAGAATVAEADAAVMIAAGDVADATRAKAVRLEAPRLFRPAHLRDMDGVGATETGRHGLQGMLRTLTISIIPHTQTIIPNVTTPRKSRRTTWRLSNSM